MFEDETRPKSKGFTILLAPEPLPRDVSGGLRVGDVALLHLLSDEDNEPESLHVEVSCVGKHRYEGFILNRVENRLGLVLGQGSLIEFGPHQIISVESSYEGPES